jgi:hypothetical protein
VLALVSRRLARRLLEKESLMWMSSLSRIRLGLLLSAACLGAVPRALASVPAGAKPRSHVRVPGRAGTAVSRALLSAKRRLLDPECQAVLSDFSSSAQNRPLREVLDSLGLSAAEHLDSLVFQDGSGLPGCADSGILAFTHVGGDTVFVCAAQFARAVEAHPSFADVVLIHETLHTLGLAENPPTTWEITARVTERCGDWRKRQLPLSVAERGGTASDAGTLALLR